MSEVQRLRDDLAFVRGVVQRHDRERPDLFGVYLAWAIYVLVGYTLLDVRPLWANWWLSLAWIPASVASAVSVRRMRARGTMVRDPELSRRISLHWGGGVALAIVAGVGLASVIPALRGPASGQVIVCLIGLVYFLAGVHFDRRFLVLGPVMIVGGIAISFLHTMPWTILGAVIALGLVVPSLFKRNSAETSDRKSDAQA